MCFLFLLMFSLCACVKSVWQARLEREEWERGVGRIRGERRNNKKIKFFITVYISN